MYSLQDPSGGTVKKKHPVYQVTKNNEDWTSRVNVWDRA
jgi:hypothetical protein